MLKIRTPSRTQITDALPEAHLDELLQGDDDFFQQQWYQEVAAHGRANDGGHPKADTEQPGLPAPWFQEVRLYPLIPQEVLCGAPATGSMSPPSVTREDCTCVHLGDSGGCCQSSARPSSRICIKVMQGLSATAPQQRIFAGGPEADFRQGG
jgi:hypothetical protein